jgi:hypothetical protein
MTDDACMPKSGVFNCIHAFLPRMRGGFHRLRANIAELCFNGISITPVALTVMVQARHSTID